MTVAKTPTARRRNDVEQHKAVLKQAEQDGRLHEQSLHATVSNENWFILEGGEYLPTMGRMRAHRKLLEDFRKNPGNVSCDRLALVMAGPPGAGKSKAEGEIRADLAPSSSWRKIDPDEFKDLILRRAFTEGEYEEIVPPGLHENEARAYLRELAALVHEESSDLAARARDEAIRRGENLVIDGTLKTYRKAESLIIRLLEANYRVYLVDVEVGYVTSLLRVNKRWAKGYLEAEDSYMEGGSLVDHLGGRWIPDRCVVGIFPDGNVSASACQRVVERLRTGYPDLRVRFERND
ncbi:zeta toxin family protein [Streptomyces sp. NPDC058548]|uniref:zeta toxin family protein n=1 Tax=Streptomyces sp. NPDC058548 TaxID=3346545 RepID=UPI0036659F00